MGGPSPEDMVDGTSVGVTGGRFGPLGPTEKTEGIESVVTEPSHKREK